jgi:hypothetical protein
VGRDARANSTDGRRLVTADGNDLVETFYIYALVLEDVDAASASEMVVLSFTKTKIKRYRNIMTRLRTIRGASNIPLFAHRIRMTATREKNSAGQSYFNVELNPAIDGDVVASLLPSDSPLLPAASEFLKSLDSGEASVSYGNDDEATGSADSTDVF